jgi:signal transduction histidine kinase
VGIGKRKNGSGFGLIGIRERVNILKGELEISGNQPQGTKVRITI